MSALRPVPLPRARRPIARRLGRALAIAGAVPCTGCHGAHFGGGAIPGAPPDWPAARNITPHPTAGIGG